MEKIICVCVCVCVNSTFGRCCHCPCWKDKGKKIKEKEKIINKETGILSQSNETHSNLGNELINNDNNEEPLNKAMKIKETTKASTNLIENQNDDEKILINPIIGEALGNKGNNKYAIEFLKNPNDNEKKLINQIINVICNGCKNNKDSESKIKFVFDDTVASDSGKPALKIFELGFGFCEKHKECVRYECENDAEYLFQCGHKMCKTHYEEVMSKKAEPGYFCKDCKTWMCGCFGREGMDTHLWCNDAKKGHYFCFKDLDKYNPYYKYKRYNEKTWRCQNHNLDF